MAMVRNKKADASQETAHGVGKQSPGQRAQLRREPPRVAGPGSFGYVRVAARCERVIPTLVPQTGTRP
jgi:hypothetical protein